MWWNVRVENPAAFHLPNTSDNQRENFVALGYKNTMKNETTRKKDHHYWNKRWNVSLTLWGSSGMNVVNFISIMNGLFYVLSHYSYILRFWTVAGFLQYGLHTYSLLFTFLSSLSFKIRRSRYSVSVIQKSTGSVSIFEKVVMYCKRYAYIP